jgi:hypothetical protein
MCECTIIVATTVLFVVHRGIVMSFLSSGNRTPVITYKSVAHFLTFRLLRTFSGTNCCMKVGDCRYLSLHVLLLVAVTRQLWKMSFYVQKVKWLSCIKICCYSAMEILCRFSGETLTKMFVCLWCELFDGFGLHL